MKCEGMVWYGMYIYIYICISTQKDNNCSPIRTNHIMGIQLDNANDVTCSHCDYDNAKW